MSVTVTIAGVDKTTEIDWRSFNLQRALTNQTDTFQFTVKRGSGAAYKPVVLDDVKVYDGATCIFGGNIITIDEEVDGYVEYVKVTAKDYTFDLDRYLVIDVFENQTILDIIKSIVRFGTSSYTVTNVDGLQVVNYIAFNYEQPSKCIQQLAQLYEFDWYVDENKDIHFFSKANNPAPFNLTDTSGNYIYKSLKIRGDIKNLHNSVIVRGGNYLGSLTSEKIVADGQATTFTQGYQYNTVFVKVNGVSKTVGIANIDNPASFDCLYNFTEKFVIFPAAVTATNVVEVGGYPYIPVIVKVRDSASVLANGEYQFKIIDKSINSKEGARDRAKAELAAWANKINEGSFSTITSGLDTGQLINVQSTIRTINTDYVISRITSRLQSPTVLIHDITLVTSKTFGMIEFLQKLLMEKDKEIVINEGEVSDEVESVDEEIVISEVVTSSKTHNPVTETITISESVTPQALNYAVKFVAGPQVPSTTKRVFNLNGSPLR